MKKLMSPSNPLNPSNRYSYLPVVDDDEVDDGGQEASDDEQAGDERQLEEKQQVFGALLSSSASESGNKSGWIWQNWISYLGSQVHFFRKVYPREMNSNIYLEVYSESETVKN